MQQLPYHSEPPAGRRPVPMDAGTEEVYQGPPGCHVHEHLKETPHEDVLGYGVYLWKRHESGPGEAETPKEPWE